MSVETDIATLLEWKRGLQPLTVSMRELPERLTLLEGHIEKITESVETMSKQEEKRAEREAERERQDLERARQDRQAATLIRVAIIGLIGVLTASLIGAAALILSSGVLG